MQGRARVRKRARWGSTTTFKERRRVRELVAEVLAINGEGALAALMQIKREEGVTDGREMGRNGWGFISLNLGAGMEGEAKEVRGRRRNPRWQSRLQTEKGKSWRLGKGPTSGAGLAVGEGKGKRK
jgi:hypothetical protein